MGRYKLIALDMDGTVLSDDGTISTANREAIQEAMDEGIVVMFSTGRGIQSSLPYVEQLELPSPIITMNGSEVWLAPHKLHERHLLEAEAVGKLWELAQKYDTWFWGGTVEGLFNRERWAEHPAALRWLKFGFQSEQLDKLAEIRSTIEQWNMFEISNSHPTNIEVNPLGVSKESGLRTLCGVLGITMDQVVAAGDSLNDLRMITAAGLGVAMGNAQEEVKRRADVITLTNEEAGVAAFIREHVLGK